MKLNDTLRLALGSIERAPVRSGLMLLAMAIGVAAVVTLSALGESVRQYVVNEFASLGTNLVIVLPGRSETTGGTLTASFGGTSRDLTIADAKALTQSYNVRRVAPIIVGAAGVQHAGLEREVAIFGGTAEMQPIRHWRMAQGQFLPMMDWERAMPICVIGGKIKSELFADQDAVGQWLRIGDSRFRVVGVLSTEGRSLGVDVEEVVVVPVASAMNLFNRQSLFRILIEANDRQVIDAVRDFAEAAIARRHHGERDVTVITQDAVVSTFDQIFGLLTVAVIGIAAISLVVAGVLIMNVMLVAVAQRTPEIGVLKSLGASAGQITQLFLVEAALLSLLGATVGVAVGLLAVWAMGKLNPVLAVSAPSWSVFAAALIALITGLVFGVGPARRAAGLDPVQALSGK